MQHGGTRFLETERLILRPFHIEDAPQVFENWASDPEVTEFLTWPTHRSLEQSLAFIQMNVEHYAEPEHYEWALYHIQDRQVIGSLGAMNFQPATRCIELGYALSRAYWGKGYATEAVRAVIRYLFDEVGMLRIQAKHDPANMASGAVMRKCGMLHEGTLRQAIRSNRGITDAELYAILQEDRPS